MESKIAELNLCRTINDLPNEILLKIFSFLTQNDHNAVGLVSNRFQDLIDNTKWPVETSVLLITEDNVREVKESIENKNIKFCFKRIGIRNVTNMEDLECILQAIGKEIVYLSMEKTAGFYLLKNNAVNLKSFEIYFDNVLENSVNNGSLNLKFFPRLEELCFMKNIYWNSSTNKLLMQLKSLKNMSSLKHFKLNCQVETEDNLIDSLLHHSITLKSLEIHYTSNVVKNLKNWQMPFSRLKNLKKLHLSGIFTPKMMNVIFSALPKETPLEHLELTAWRIDYNKILALIIDKWMNSLQFLELNHFWHLTDDAIMEFGKLHNLRVLKLLSCEKITKMSLIAGIALNQNIFINELNLEYISDLDAMGLHEIVSRFPNLRFLTLKYVKKAITNTSLASICRFSTRLRSLDINDCYNITDKGMIGFGNHAYSINRLRLLVKLTLKNCHYLTDRTLIEALKWPELLSLELHNCTKITLYGIEGLVKSCPLLEILSLPSTVFLNDDALFVIGKGLKRLRQLEITACKNIANENRNHLKDVFKTLQDSTNNATFPADCKLELQ